ncbi:Rne/Rng family ribonuclease [Cryptosporangium minutisporangium]|uniref:Rne/Rng family ribonuclease n=1 Tax=Cryptosporangium minutisporangium TaxID=113569 RepID=UPI003CD070FA
MPGSTTGSPDTDSSAGTAHAAGSDAEASPTPEPAARPARRRAARRAAGPPAEPPLTSSDTVADVVPAAVITPTPAPEPPSGSEPPADAGWPVVPAPVTETADAPAAQAEPAPRRRATRSRRRTAEPVAEETATPTAEPTPPAESTASAGSGEGDAPVNDPTPPDVAVEVTAPRTRRRRRVAAAGADGPAATTENTADAAPADTPAPADSPAPTQSAAPVASAEPAEAEAPAPTSRRRRRLSSAASGGAPSAAAPSAAAPSAEAPSAGAGPEAGAAESGPLRGETAASEPAAPAVTPPAAVAATSPFTPAAPPAEPVAEVAEEPTTRRTRVRRAPMVTFMAPEPSAVPIRPVEPVVAIEAEDEAEDLEDTDETEDSENTENEVAETDDLATDDEDDGGDDSRRRRRRGRRGRGRGRGENGADSAENDADESAAPADGTSEDDAEATASDESDENDDEAAEATDGSDDEAGSGSRRRRRRRRRGAGEAEVVTSDDPPNTVVKVRQPVAPTRSIEDEVQGVKGSTRLEAKRQRRREGRESNRRRPPVLTEAEFLARREAVERVMVVRQIGDRTQIAVLEDDVLVEHYVTKASSTSYAGNVYLGRVQNVLPSMEAAFVDIGKGRNAVLYAGEVNWDAAGMEGRPRKIEVALKSGDSVLVQVTKDPIGHKGARLTSQVSLPGRFLVYVPEGQMTGISRKLPDTERKRLKDILKKIVPENAGVIIRTAAEGASEAELTHDVERLEAQWQVIKEKATKGGAPVLLNAEPDLVIRVIRDVFNEDFSKLVVSGTEAWPQVEAYVRDVSPDLAERLVHHTAETDVFAAYRIDEQITKALDRKVWLPSGGSLVIDRTEAMTVVDVNTGKFTGQGGNLEETVTRNNLEAAEEIVRQLRLRDIGGIIVIDFIDMVLEANRDLVLRRLTECLGRDRTKHQVAEVTSLGLVQMTRKRVGQGLLEAFSETCEVCRGRGVILHNEPLIGRQTGGNNGNGNGQQQGEPAAVEPKEGRRSRRKRGGSEPVGTVAPPAVAAVAAIHAASTRTVALAPGDEDEDVIDVVDETADALIVDDIARETEVEGDLAYDVADADVVEVAPVERSPGRRRSRRAERPAGSPAGADDAAKEGTTGTSGGDDSSGDRAGGASADGRSEASGDGTAHRHAAGIGTAHAAAAAAVGDAGADVVVKPADQMVVSGAAATPPESGSTPDGGAAIASEPAPATTSRPRRARRAASRPAGPPEGADAE